MSDQITMDDVHDYCTITGEDSVTVCSQLMGNGITVFGATPRKKAEERARAMAEAARALQAAEAAEALAQAALDAARKREADLREADLREAEAANASEREQEAAMRKADMEMARDIALKEAQGAGGGLGPLRSGGRTSVAHDGTCSCPKCGAPLRLILAPPPAVREGSPAGVLTARGKAGTPAPGRRPSKRVLFGARQVLRATPPTAAFKAGVGSCICKCPSCGTVLTLSIGPQGYDSRQVAKSVPGGYAAVAQAVHGDDCFGVF